MHNKSVNRRWLAFRSFNVVSFVVRESAVVARLRIRIVAVQRKLREVGEHVEQTEGIGLRFPPGARPTAIAALRPGSRQELGLTVAAPAGLSLRPAQTMTTPARRASEGIRAVSLARASG